MITATLNLAPIGILSDEALLRLSSANKVLHLERNPKGELVIMSPIGFGTGKRNNRISYLLEHWNQQTKAGETADSSTGFRLNNSAVRSPDASWISHERIATLTPEQLDGFAPICPDFVIELMSKTDRLTEAQEKMQEWVENGCRLAWLINPYEERVYVYRADGTLRFIENFDSMLSGEDVLPGFTLELSVLR
jgi:Uma2 family endonuclease